MTGEQQQQDDERPVSAVTVGWLVCIVFIAIGVLTSPDRSQLIRGWGPGTLVMAVTFAGSQWWSRRR